MLELSRNEESQLVARSLRAQPDGIVTSTIVYNQQQQQKLGPAAPPAVPVVPNGSLPVGQQWAAAEAA